MNHISKYFHALSHKDFRYLWYGQCISLLGTWIQRIALAWLVLTLTGSPFLLGLVGSVQFLPITCFSLFAGVIIDKYPKRNILLITQTVNMMLAFVLALLVFTNTVQFFHVLVLALLLGVTHTFDSPTRQSFNIEIVGKEDVMNAVAINSSTFNLARIVGPAIGAIMMASFGAAWCFLINGLSYLAVIYSLLKIEAKPPVRKKKTGVGIMEEIKDGILYIAKDKVLAETILLVSVLGTFVYNWDILVPVFTQNVLGLEEKAYGFLLSCLGFGSLIGALATGIRSNRGPKLSASLFFGILASIFVGLIGITGSVYVTGVFLVITGFVIISFSTNANALLQINSQDEYRSRVMSIYSLVFAGTTPFGNLFSGFVAEKYGAENAFLICGMVSLIACLIIMFVFRNK